MLDVAINTDSLTEDRPGLAEATVATTAYNALLDRILMRELTPGTVLQEVRLAAILRVSRTPLREALRRLEGEGLVGEPGDLVDECGGIFEGAGMFDEDGERVVATGGVDDAGVVEVVLEGAGLVGDGDASG